MSGEVVALVAAVFGVTGTLFAPVLAQRSQAKALKADFERQQEAARIQWDREQEQAELAQRRACYIATNAAYRRYRIQLMQYVWYVHRDVAGDAERQEVEAARHAHHAAFAEAQMVASGVVLGELDAMAQALSDTYRKIMCLQEGNPEPDGSFDEITTSLESLWERWKKMRLAMRVDLGANTSPVGPPRSSWSI